MTENMAGRGEGLAGLVAKWREAVRQMEKWPELQSDACVLKTCTEQLETALEAAAPAGTAPRPYRALNEGGGCKECHHGNDWTVVYTPPDGSEEIGEGETWDNESPADEMAESLNDAFGRGWCAALATPSPQAPQEQCNVFSTTSAREQSSATAAANLSAAREIRQILIDAYNELIVGTTYKKPEEAITDFIVKAANRIVERQEPAGSGAQWSCLNFDHACNLRGYCVNKNCTESGSPRKVGEDAPCHITIEYGARALEAVGKPYSIRDARVVAITLNALLRPSSAPVGEPEPACVCAQGVTKCPRHGAQPAQREPCPLCGAPLGYCAEGEYCTKEDCKYVS